MSEKTHINNAGFTLIEVLFAMMLVGLAIVSLLTANRALTQANGAGTDLSTAEFLVEQIRELTALLPVIDPETGTTTFGAEEGTTLANYDDLDDFDSKNFSPPIDCQRQTLSEFSDLSQQVTVVNVNANNFDQVVTDHSSVFVKVTVEIFRGSDRISSGSWLRARY